MTRSNKTPSYTDIESSLSDPIEHKSKKNSILNKFLGTLVLGVLLLSVFFFWQQKTLTEDIAQNKIKIEQKEKAIEQSLEKFGIDDVKFLKSGKEILNEAEKKRIIWSKIYQTIENLEKEGRVQLATISITEEQEVSLTGKTQSPEVLARFLKILTKKKEITNVFLSQFNKSEADKSKSETSFSLTFKLKN